MTQYSENLLGKQPFSDICDNATIADSDPPVSPTRAPTFRCRYCGEDLAISDDRLVCTASCGFTRRIVCLPPKQYNALLPFITQKARRLRQVRHG